MLRSSARASAWIAVCRHRRAMLGTAALLATLGAGCRTIGGKTLLGGSKSNSISGYYVCRSMGTHPCDARTVFHLGSNGVWSTGEYSGPYVMNGDAISFRGFGGPASWGDARFISRGDGNTITFGSGASAVVYQQPAPIPAGLPGTYKCQGCFGTIILNADGTWKYPDGTDGGNYYLLGGELQFSGLSSGPAEWGPAIPGAGNISFNSAARTIRFLKQ